MAMRTAPLLCLISVGLLVSIFQQADGVGVDCLGIRMCGSECTVLPLKDLKICSCSGPCVDKEMKRLMRAGYNKTEAEKKMTQVTGSIF